MKAKRSRKRPFSIWAAAGIAVLAGPRPAPATGWCWSHDTGTGGNIQPQLGRFASLAPHPHAPPVNQAGRVRST